MSLMASENIEHQPASADPAPEPPKPKRSLGEILSALKQIEELAQSDDFDPASIVGDLAENAEQRMKKIDSIDHVVTELESYAARTVERANKIAARARAASNKALGLKNYVKQEMEKHGWMELLGTERKIKFVTHHTPSLVLNREATADDMIQLGNEFVRRHPAVFEFNKKAIGDAIKAEKLKLDFATFVYSTRVEFDERDRPDIAPEKKPKKGIKK
jgi:hypothetical protein